MILPAGILTAAMLLVPQDEGSATLEQDARFALQLTSQLGFDNFSEIVLDRAMEEARDGADRSAVLLARCQVLEMVTRRPAGPAEQLSALERASQAYLEFLATKPTGDQANIARRQLGAVAFNYAEKLRPQLEGLSDSERQEKLAKAEEVFSQGLTQLNQLVSWWRNIEDPDVREGAQFLYLYPASFYRALIYLNWGLLYPMDSVERQDNVSRSIELLEDFAFSAGELSPAGLMAYRHMADGRAALGDIESAEEFYYFIIEEGVTAEAAASMTPGELRSRRDVQQDAFLGLLEALEQGGRNSEIPQVAATFQQWVTDNRVTLNQAGYTVQLKVAEDMIHNGRGAEALGILRDVAAANQQNVLRLEANALMGEAIDSAPSDAAIDLELLFQAGQGAYFQERYQEGAALLRQLIARLQPGDEEVGAQAYYYLGRALEKDGLLLEAAVAYQRGFQRFDDVEGTNEDLANGWRKLAEGFRNADPRDTYLDAFFKSALDAAASIGTGAPDLALVRAARSDMRQALDDAKKAGPVEAGSAEARQLLNQFDRAIASWKRIEPHSPYYDEALVSIGQCEYQKFNWDPSAADRALTIFDQFITKHVKDPQFAPTTPKAKQTRANMIPVADYYRGATHRAVALAGDQSAWQRMLTAFDGYEQRNPDQVSFIGAVMANRVEAYLALGQEANALAQYDAMTAAQVSDGFLNLSSFGIYRFFKDKAEAATEPAAIEAANKQAVKYLHIANSVTATPQWPNLLNEARLHAEVGDLATSAKLLAETIERFGGKKGFTDVQLFYARLDLVQAYLELGNTGSAVPIMDQLLAERPNNLSVKSMAVKIKAGFPVYRNGRVVQIPGEDTAEAYETAAVLVAELLATADTEARNQGKSRFESATWWEAKLQQAYIFYKWGQVDGAQQGKHRKTIESLERLAPEFGLQYTGPEIPQMFRWLKGQS